MSLSICFKIYNHWSSLYNHMIRQRIRPVEYLTFELLGNNSKMLEFTFHWFIFQLTDFIFSFLIIMISLLFFDNTLHPLHRRSRRVGCIFVPDWSAQVDRWARNDWIRKNAWPEVTALFFYFSFLAMQS